MVKTNASFQYKAIISDFDGTLTGPEFTISKRVREAVRKWQDAGFHFSIATGKPFNSIIKDACTFLSITDPVIVASGAEILNPQTEKIMHDAYVPDSDGRMIVQLLQKQGVLFEIQTHSTVYASSEKLMELQKHKTYSLLKHASYDSILKIRLVTTRDDQDAIHEFVETNITDNFKSVFVTQSNTPYSKGVDITARDASKYTAVNYLAHFLGLTKEELVGIGDSETDENLFRACGYRVVMENAPKHVLGMADFVVPDYTHDGVAVLIEKLLAQE